MFYSVILLENGLPMFENLTLQIPSYFTKNDLKILLEETYDKKEGYTFMIKDLYFDDTLEIIAEKLCLTEEDTIEINCVVNQNSELIIETDDIITSLYFYYEKNELFLSLLNKKINAYKNFQFVYAKDTFFTVKQIVNEESFISFNNEYVENDKVLLKNVIKFVKINKFLTNENTVINQNQEILLKNENKILNFTEENDTFIFLTDKNEILKENSTIFNFTNEIILSSFLSKNSIICTNKLIYILINNEEVKRTSHIFPFVDKCFINDEYFFIVYYNKLSVQKISDFKLVKLIEVDKQISNFSIENNLIFLSSHKKLFIYKIK